MSTGGQTKPNITVKETGQLPVSFYVDPYINSKGKLKWVSSRYVYNAEAGDIELTHT